jgi:hypothetical protein
MVVAFIPHRLALRYHRAGWLLKPLLDATGRLSHHARYAMLAVKRGRP